MMRVELADIAGYNGFSPCEAARQFIFTEDGWSVTHILWANIDGFLFEEAEFWWKPRE